MKRRMFLSVVAVALMSSFVFGQEEDKKPREGRGKGRGDVMTAALEKAKLSDDQKEKVATIMKESQEAMKAAREAKDREAGRKVMTERNEKIMAVLTDDQKEIVKKHIEESRAARGERGKKKKQE